LKDATENFYGDPFADKERADDSRREAETAGEAAGQRERVDQEAGHHRLRNLAPLQPQMLSELYTKRYASRSAAFAHFDLAQNEHGA